MTILVTGAAGFIGSNFTLNWLGHWDEKLIALDKLTYAGNLENLKSGQLDKLNIQVKKSGLKKNLKKGIF